MKLRDIMMCIECEEIFEPTDTYQFDKMQCPACSNIICVRLSRWLLTMNGYEKHCRTIGRKNENTSRA